MSDVQQLERLVPFNEVAASLNCKPRVLARVCEQLEIPVTKLTKKNRALTWASYDLLLRRTAEGK